jgi:hypothetical protein
MRGGGTGELYSDRARVDWRRGLAPFRRDIVRLVVSIYLVVATACGPFVCCCCAPGRAAAAMGQVLQGDRRGGDHARGPSCCGAGEPASKVQTKHFPDAEPPTNMPCSPEPPCPCQKDGECSKYLAPSTEPRVEAPVERLLGSAEPALWQLTSRFDLRRSTFPLADASPSLTSSAANPRAPHVLRC